MPFLPRPRSLRADVALLALAGLAVSSSGCSLAAPRHQAVTIRASDPSAEIKVDGEPAGTGSATVSLARDKPHLVIATTPDNRRAAAAINRKLSPTGWLDVAGGCVLGVPFLGALSPGFWQLESNDVLVRLD